MTNTSSCIIRKLVWKYSLIDAYPKHLMDGMSDSESSTLSTSGESDESGFSMSGVGMGFGNKIDQDAFVFQRIMGNLSPDKLLFLLGQEQRVAGKDDNDSGSDSESETETLSHSLTSDSKTVASEVPHPVPSAIAITTPRKCVQFALENDGEVKVSIRVFEKEGDKLKLWWTKKEMTKIRKDAVLLVHRYRSRFPEYIASVTAILEMDICSEQAAVKELQMLVQQYDARGLEQHIVDQTCVLLKNHVDAVLEEVQLLREEERLHDAEGGETLREKSLLTSRPGGLLAEKLAECDTIKCNSESTSKLTIPEGSFVKDLGGKDLALPPQKSCCVIS
jgi:hypothetical protein